MANKVKCPDCGKECAPRGLHLHQTLHCPKRSAAAPETNEHKHKWRLLKRTDEREAEAIRQGYKKYCEECEEIE